MQTSGWDIALSVSTVVLAVATAALAIVAIVAGVIAVRELGQAKEAAEQTRTLTEQTRKLAEVDIRRRRAEASQDALRRFMTIHDQQHPTMLAAARAVTKDRKNKARSNPNETVERCRIPELLTERAILANEASDDMLEALQNCLDGVEEIGLGVELKVYDKYVLFHGAFCRIDQLVEWGRAYIELSRRGRIPQKDAQPTAYAQTLALQTRLRAIRDEGAPKKLDGALDEGLGDEDLEADQTRAETSGKGKSETTKRGKRR